MSAPSDGPTNTTPATLSVSGSVGEISGLQQRLDAALGELEGFRHRVRDRAISGYRSGDWDLDQLNESLRNLGLEPFEPTYVYRASLNIHLTVRVDEADPDRARDALDFFRTDEARQALQAAVATVLRQRGDELSMSAHDLSVWADYPRRSEAD